MLLRRITEHVKAQNWTAVALDFVIVVVGVFIGIQVANWNEARQERQREAHYLERLDKEFDVIRTRLIDGSEVFERSVRSIDMLLAVRRRYAEAPNEPLPEDEALTAAIGNVASGRVPAGAPAAFKEMVASGALETLSSDDLRQALFAYDEFSAVARDGWRTLRDEHRDSANALQVFVDSAAPQALSGDVAISFDIEIIAFATQEFFEDPAVQGHLNILLRVQMNQYALVQRQLALAEEIEALIADELR